MLQSRVVLIALFAATLVLSLLAILSIKRESDSNIQRALSMQINRITAWVFLIQAGTAIKVAFDVDAGAFNSVTLSFLVTSCGCTLLYELLMVHQVVQKLIKMQPRFWKSVSLVCLASIIISKVISLSIFCYITARDVTLGDTASVYTNSFADVLGELSEFSTIIGNLIFNFFKMYAIVCYTFFLHTNIIKDLRLDILGEHKEVNWIIGSLKSLLGLCLFASATSFVSALLTFGFIKHSQGVAIDSVTSAILLLTNIWLDNHFTLAIKIHRRLSVSSRHSRRSIESKQSISLEEKTVLMTTDMRRSHSKGSILSEPKPSIKASMRIKSDEEIPFSARHGGEATAMGEKTYTRRASIAGGREVLRISSASEMVRRSSVSRRNGAEPILFPAVDIETESSLDGQVAGRQSITKRNSMARMDRKPNRDKNKMKSAISGGEGKTIKSAPSSQHTKETSSEQVNYSDSSKSSTPHSSVGGKSRASSSGSVKSCTNPPALPSTVSRELELRTRTFSDPAELESTCANQIPFLLHTRLHFIKSVSPLIQSRKSFESSMDSSDSSECVDLANSRPGLQSRFMTAVDVGSGHSLDIESRKDRSLSYSHRLSQKPSLLEESSTDSMTSNMSFVPSPNTNKRQSIKQLALAPIETPPEVVETKSRIVGNQQPLRAILEPEEAGVITFQGRLSQVSASPPCEVGTSSTTAQPVKKIPRRFSVGIIVPTKGVED
ncbi:hypothetical protein BC830DRAFT_1153493 [Chytriomyces sp. MP71]|nr:hypothetical protein BC830DRAFT_1153493 [Chytriomyces sp. MP71]